MPECALEVTPGGQQVRADLQRRPDAGEVRAAQSQTPVRSATASSALGDRISPAAPTRPLTCREPRLFGHQPVAPGDGRAASGTGGERTRAIVSDLRIGDVASDPLRQALDDLQCRVDVA